MPFSSSGWLITIGAVGGSIGGFSASALLFRYLNIKVNKLDVEKQDKNMCGVMHKNLVETTKRIEAKLDVGVIVARDDLQKVVIKLDDSTKIQNTILQSMSALIENMKDIHKRGDP